MARITSRQGKGALNMGRKVRMLPVMALALATSVATPAAAMDGYWKVQSSDKGWRLGLIFPEFSSNEFSGMMLTCDRRSRSIEVYEFTDAAVRPRQTTIHIRLDGQSLRLPARPIHQEAYGTWDSIATIPYGSPAAQRILAARNLTITSAVAHRLSGFAAAKTQWQRACQL